MTEEINQLAGGFAFFREVSEIREKKMPTGVNKSLTRAAVQTFIDTIYAYSAEKIEITYTFGDMIERAVAYIEQHTESPLGENRKKSLIFSVEGMS